MAFNTDKFRGTGVAMITPFSADGEIDFRRLEEHTERLIGNGIDYLVILGTTAETPTLSKEERREVIRCITDSAAGRVPLVIGIGGNNTRAVIEEIRESDLSRAMALLSVAPYYNKPNQDGLYQHFSAIASIAELPLIIYNIPGRTGVNVNTDTLLRLAADLPEQIIGVKEASGDLMQIMEIIRQRPEGFKVISGDDGVAFPVVACGGDGVISVAGNALPGVVSEMIRAALNGQMDKARSIHYKVLPLIPLLFKEGNPAGVKALMEIFGMIDNNLRLPLIPASKKLYDDIAAMSSLF